MGSAALGEAVKGINAWATEGMRQLNKPVHVGEVFGSLAFNDKVQQARLPKPVYKSLRDTITHGKPLDISTADAVATALKDWAVEHGASHYTHWFQPMTGITAEKHDSFYNPTGDGRALAEFSGKELVRGEPDASSFPSGGMRTTFEARGYTAWDPTSPPWLLLNGNSATLVIPTAFVSWTGEALDKKTPLLRSMEALSTQAVRVLKLFGSTCHARHRDLRPRAGILPDRPQLLLRASRPDQRRPHAVRRQAAEGSGDGRSVLRLDPGARAGLHGGGRGANSTSVGVPIKTRHNEVAPSQYEIAPIFESANVATDHQMMTMETLKRVAPTLRSGVPAAREAVRRRQRLGQAPQLEHGRRPRQQPAEPGRHAARQHAVPVLLHRGHPRGGQVPGPAAHGDRPRRQRSSPRRQRSAAGHHLGVPRRHAHRHLRADREGRRQEHASTAACSTSASSVLPQLPRDAGDRNRTSPFAFTGNKFEFRAVGSSQNVAFPATCLNVAVAESLDALATELEKMVAAGKGDRQEAFTRRRRPAEEDHQAAQADHLQRQRLLGRVAEGGRQARPAEPEEHRRRAAGDREARGGQDVREVQDAQRAANCTRATRSTSRPTARPSTSKAQLMVLMANRYILPAALEYQKNVGQSVAAAKAGGVPSKEGASMLTKIVGLVDALPRQTEAAGEGARSQQTPPPRSTPSTCATRSFRPWSRCARSATRSRW